MPALGRERHHPQAEGCGTDKRGVMEAALFPVRK